MFAVRLPLAPSPPRPFFPFPRPLTPDPHHIPVADGDDLPVPGAAQRIAFRRRAALFSYASAHQLIKCRRVARRALGKRIGKHGPRDQQVCQILAAQSWQQALDQINEVERSA